jgi:phosphatidylinositol alpha-1,6-mannosyltransferase
MKILFLYLDAFRQTGGIEKFNRAFMKALDDISKDGLINYKAFSVCDDLPETKYVSVHNHRGFRNRKFVFTINALFGGLKNDLLVIGHLNLAPVALLIKLAKPKIKMILIAHGIEVWKKQSFIKSKLIKKTDTILAVSKFTREKILEHNKLSPDKIKIFPNTLDPFFIPPDKKEKPNYLLERYGLSKDTEIILTITRINRYEVYKGYDLVLQVLPDIVKLFPNVKYLLCGKYGPFEETKLKQFVEQYKLADHFIFPGFIKEEELIDHYLLADVFVMPSKKEGFGIVFIEAAACGTPVIAGNKDGSVDALLNGQIGKLVDPDNLSEIKESIIDAIKNPVINNRDLLLENFGFEQFKKRLRMILIEN